MSFDRSVPDRSDCNSLASASLRRELSISERSGSSICGIDGGRSKDSNASFSARSLRLLARCSTQMDFVSQLTV